MCLSPSCVVRQPSEFTPFTALQFANIVHKLTGEEALPPGAFNVVTGFGGDAGAPLAAHKGVCLCVLLARTHCLCTPHAQRTCLL